MLEKKMFFLTNNLIDPDIDLSEISTQYSADYLQLNDQSISQLHQTVPIHLCSSNCTSYINVPIIEKKKYSFLSMQLGNFCSITINIHFTFKIHNSLYRNKHLYITEINLVEL